MLILAISENLYKLLQDSRLAPITPLCKLCGVMVVTKDLAIMLVITILCPKDCGAYRASEVIDVVFAVQSCDV